jgi:hypothetical protein
MQFDTKIAVVLRDDLAVWKDQRDGLGASTDSLLRGLNVQAVTDRAVENIQQLGTAHLDDHAWHACSWCPARPRGHRGASRVACMQALTSTYRDDAGHIGQEILYREAHSRLEVEEEGRALELRRRREAVPPRIRGAADPHRAPVRSLSSGHTSNLDALPHQIRAVYREILPAAWMRYGWKLSCQTTTTRAFGLA